MINRVELFDYHNVFDVDINGSHKYVYALPYYEHVYVGRHIYPDGVWLYSMTHETYLKLIMMKRKNKRVCHDYVINNIDKMLLTNGENDEYVYLGDKKDYLGSLPSVVIQSILQYY